MIRLIVFKYQTCTFYAYVMRKACLFDLCLDNFLNHKLDLSKMLLSRLVMVFVIPTKILIIWQPPTPFIVRPRLTGIVEPPAILKMHADN